MEKNKQTLLRYPTRKNELEFQAWQQSQYVCGIDEVECGCLAGPLVAAAVILPFNETSHLLQDSKLLSEEGWHKGAFWIAKNCCHMYGIVDHKTIDRYNIFQATLITMKRVFVHLLATAPKPSAILIAASIIAKIKRDEIMGKLLMIKMNSIYNKVY